MLEIKVILTADQALLGALTALGGVAAKADEGRAPVETEQVPGQIAIDLDPLTAKIVPVTPVPKQEPPQYTLEEVRTKMVALKKAGKGPEIKALIEECGAKSLTSVPVEKYSYLMEKAGELE